MASVVGLRVAILYSGGKDSTYAASLAHRMRHEIACLVTLMPRSVESYLFHYPNADKTHLQAKAMGVPLLRVKTEGVKEEEILDLERALRKAVDRFGVEGVFTGGIASRYQRDRFEKVCGGLHLECFNPLWEKNPEEYLRELVKQGFQVMITGVSALGFDRGWLGRIITHNMIDELKDLHRRYGVHIAFEGGEAETYVTDCPLFLKRIEIVETEEHWMGDSGYLRVKKAQLVSKPFPMQLNSAEASDGKAL